MWLSPYYELLYSFEFPHPDILAEGKACPEYPLGSPVLNHTKLKWNLFLLLLSAEWLKWERWEERRDMIRLAALKLYEAVIVQQPNMNIKSLQKGQAKWRCFGRGRNVTRVNNVLTKFAKVYKITSVELWLWSKSIANTCKYPSLFLKGQSILISKRYKENWIKLWKIQREDQGYKINET